MSNCNIYVVLGEIAVKLQIYRLVNSSQEQNPYVTWGLAVFQRSVEGNTFTEFCRKVGVWVEIGVKSKHRYNGLSDLYVKDLCYTESPSGIQCTRATAEFRRA